MQTLDKNNNLPVEKIFEEITEIYESLSVFARVETENIHTNKRSIRMILTVIAFILVGAGLLISVINITHLCLKIKSYTFLTYIFYAISSVIMFFNVVLYEHKLRKEVKALTGYKIKNVNSYTSFYVKCAHVKTESLNLCKDYCDILITQKTLKNSQTISSYLHWYVLPFLVNLISASVSIDFTNDTAIANIIKVLLWGFAFVLIYNLIKMLKERNIISLKILKLHIDYCILNRKAS